MNFLSRHRLLLNDNIRMRAYEAAIHATVKPGMVVADIGAGLGILGRMALDAGAKKVYAIEYDAETIAQAEHLERITWIHGLSGGITLPEKVDVVVSETLGSLALDENALPTLIDARRRFLKKGGVMIPQAVTLFVAPAETLSRNKVQAIATSALLSKPISQTVNFVVEKNPVFTLTITFKIMRDGTLSGFAGWFDLNLAKGIAFSTSPDTPETHWKQGFLPIRNPPQVNRGQTLRFELVMEPDALPTSVTTHIGYDYSISSPFVRRGQGR